MARNYKQSTICIGDRMIDREITGIDKGAQMKDDVYHYRCDCGATGTISRYSLFDRIKRGATGCSKCYRPAKKGMEFSYQQAIADMEFVNRHWKPSVNIGRMSHR